MMNDLRGERSGRGLGALLSLAFPSAELAPTAGEATAEAVPARSEPLGGWPKRLTDVAIAIAALALAAPLMLLVAFLIKMTDRGPVFYAHGRVGFGGRPFRCYKFRSMAANADALLAQHLARDHDAAREWRESQKLTHDPRVTFFGQMLRKSSIDELPQLFNVLRGDMSCVGPRPITPDELERYGPYIDYYLRTRPGLTGLWQVTGRSSTEYASRVQLDTHYVRGWSLRFDFAILCRTPVALARFSEVR
jgi:exopolysaccharide production protein ExoY